MGEFSEELRGIEREISQLSAMLEGIDARIRNVEDWITERRRFIDATEQRFERLEQVMDERFHMVEKDLDDHQSWIDRHEATAKAENEQRQEHKADWRVLGPVIVTTLMSAASLLWAITHAK